jgi:predicted ATPase/DNA-binding SARP family transcriptional activator
MLRLSFLGAFDARLEEKPIKEFESSKVRALLAYLVVEADKPHSRDKLAGMFWGELNDETAGKNLRQALSNLRKTIRDDAAERPLLNVSAATVQARLDSDLWLDTRAFASLLRETDSHPHRELETCLACARRMEEALTLYRGAFLEGFFLKESDSFQDWIVIHREHFQQQAADALHGLITFHKRRGEIKPAIIHAQRLVALDPWREEAHAALIELLALDDQRSAALKQYETCRNVLEKEFGVEPQAETTRLYGSIRANRLPALETRAAPNNLPADSTSFIGRARERTLLADRLQRADTRLVTLTGLGGAGKTRLALQAAREQLYSYANGVFFVQLGGLASHEAIPQAIAEAIGFTFASSGEPRAQLLNHLRQKETLLILDNFEHLLEGADFLSALLKTCPNLTLLVTSREPLRLQAEWIFDVGGLDASSSDTSTPLSTSLALDPVSQASDSLQLFESRASQLLTHFTLTEDNLDDARELCNLLDGLPLGIELAAAAIRQFTPRQIAEQIRANLDFLSTSLRDAPERQHSLRAVFDYSWNLLTKAEQTALAKVSVFRGGFTEEAAGAIADADAQTLFTLSEKSLTQRNANGRYNLHELIRQFAGEKLSEQNVIEEKHSEYFLKWLNQFERELRIADPPAVRAASLELGNIRAAWNWACKNQCVDWLDLAAQAFSQFLDARSLFVEAGDAFEKALEALDSAGDGLAGSGSDGKRMRARYSGHVGWSLQRRGSLDEARVRIESCLKDVEESGDKVLIRTWQRRMGYVCWMKAEHERAEALSQAALESARADEDELDMLDCMNNITLIANTMGNHAKAAQFAGEAVEIARQVSPLSLAYAHSNLGLAHYYLGDYAPARKNFLDAIALSQQLENPHTLALATSNLGIIEKTEGEFEKAVAYFRQAGAIQQDLGNRLGIAANLSNLGSTFSVMKKFAEGKQAHAQALAILREISHRWGVTLVLNDLASDALELKDYDSAKEFLREGLPLSLEIESPPLTLNGLIQTAGLLHETGKSARALEILAYVLAVPELDSENVEAANIWWERAAASVPAKKAEAIRKSAPQGELKRVAENALKEM